MILNEKLLAELKEYIEEHLSMLDFCCSKAAMPLSREIFEDCECMELEDFIRNHRKPTFRQVLFGLIDQKGTSDSEIYRKAGIDRRHFSKIRSTPDYQVGKNTAIALALALELDEKEIGSLLGAAGYSLSDCDTFDLVIQFCIGKRIYDLHSVNQALDYFSLKPLAGACE